MSSGPPPTTAPPGAVTAPKKKKSGWNEMSCLERCAKILMVLTFVLLVLALALNIYMIVVATKDTWFVRCHRCTTAAPPGDKNCGAKCCNDCTKEDEVFFYVMRSYNMIFAIVGCVAEFRLEIFFRYMKACGFYFSRGFFQIFIGFLTVSSGLSGDPMQEVFAQIIGFGIVIVGSVNFCLGLCCYSEYDEQSREKEAEARYGSDQKAGGTAGGGPPARAGAYAANDGAAAGGGGGAAGGGGGGGAGGSEYTYTYNGQTYQYNAGGGAGGGGKETAHRI